jgi:hypothetical protein
MLLNTDIDGAQGIISLDEEPLPLLLARSGSAVCKATEFTEILSFLSLGSVISVA